MYKDMPNTASASKAVTDLFAAVGIRRTAHHLLKSSAESVVQPLMWRADPINLRMMLG